ncbi:unnamed protein product [Mytilus coruscus]|uniref:Uncharacterized protein n=1 Tax=Mytilus coruscus TaxID=42192 RepID=A0A6J8AHC6_MYTCO|nr:unnamed protein product [Mytilus coruscus]
MIIWKEWNVMENGGDNTVLVAAVCLFRIPILILSSLPNSQPVRIIPRDVALEQTLYLGHIAEFHCLSLIPDQAQSIGEHVDCVDHNILCEVCGTLDCNTCNSLNNTNEIVCHRCGTIHTENQCLFNSSEDIKQNDRNKDHDKFDVDLYSNTTLDSMLEENFDPDDDNEIRVGKPHKGPNDSTDTLHENDMLLSNDQNFELINKWLQHKLLEFEDQSFGKGILLSKDERSVVFYHFLKLHGFVLPFKHEIDGEFILVNHPFMDLYDDFRSYMALIFSGLYVVYLTNDVRRWASLFNHTCMSNIYSNCIITLNEDSNYGLVQYLLRIRNPDQEEDYNSDEAEE